MFLIPAEFQDVPLRDPYVLQNHPRRMRKILRLAATQFRRKVFDDIIKLGVRAPTCNQISKILPQMPIVVFGHGVSVAPAVGTTHVGTASGCPGRTKANEIGERDSSHRLYQAGAARQPRDGLIGRY